MMIEIFRKRIDFLCMFENISQSDAFQTKVSQWPMAFQEEKLEIKNIPFKVKYMKIQNNKQENCLNADDLMNVMNIQSVEYIFK